MAGDVKINKTSFITLF